jgi:hypothetical protein
MQSILAESAPYRGRAVALAVVLAVVASLAIVASRPRPRHHEHHRLQHIGKCMYGYAYLTR